MVNYYRFFLKLSLILIYLVIAAGAIVRMTGSGMGCPDWPKCFGYLIPPTERSQLEWKPNHEYQEGEVIIVEESLRVATTDFTSTQAYFSENWEPYTRHDYALFNPVHTWIEFINRLLGALAGLATILLLFSALGRLKSDTLAPIGAFIVVLGMGFQAWLGKTVVDSNLLPFKITLHMGMALLLVFILIFLLFKEQKKGLSLPQQFSFKLFSYLALTLTLIQIGMGTQVRQFIDVQMKKWSLEGASQWLNEIPTLFYVHRSFSLLVLGIHLYLAYVLLKNKKMPHVFSLILITLGLEISTGIWMYYFDFPFSSQPLHLVFASMLFGAQSYFILEVNRKT